MANNPSLFFDSNVYINFLRAPGHSNQIGKIFSGSHLYVLSKIVLMELWAGASNAIEKTILLQHERSFPHLPFSDENFVEAGHVMREMAERHRFEPKMRKQLTWDILIALNAKENNSLLLTQNTADFSKIRKFVKFDFSGI